VRGLEVPAKLVVHSHVVRVADADADAIADKYEPITITVTVTVTDDPFPDVRFIHGRHVDVVAIAYRNADCYADCYADGNNPGGITDVGQCKRRQHPERQRHPQRQWRCEAHRERGAEFSEHDENRRAFRQRQHREAGVDGLRAGHHILAEGDKHSQGDKHSDEVLHALAYPLPHPYEHGLGIGRGRRGELGQFPACLYSPGYISIADQPVRQRPALPGQHQARRDRQVDRERLGAGR